MIELHPFPVSLSLSLCSAASYREREYPPHLWKIAENKQNIVTGHLEHERTLKKQQHHQETTTTTATTTGRDSASGRAGDEELPRDVSERTLGG